MRERTGPPRGMCAEPRLDRPLEPSQQLCSLEGPPTHHPPPATRHPPGCFHAVCLWPEDTARLGEGGESRGLRSAGVGVERGLGGLRGLRPPCPTGRATFQRCRPTAW